MNKEILFRAIEFGSNEFVYGDLRRGSVDTCICDIEGDVCLIVLEETIGQCIVKNYNKGGNIFEGDIVTDSEGYLFVIDYSDECFAFLGYPYNKTACGEILPIVPKMIHEIKGIIVIGNIHQNKELLE